MKPAAAAFIALSIIPAAHAEPASKTLVFDFVFDNSSMEPTSAAEEARVKKASDDLRTALEKSGEFDVISGRGIEFSSVQGSGKCSPEERKEAQKADAPLVACGWIQKVSNLILNLNVVIEDSMTGQQLRGGSVDIRGNTDDSWGHGLRYLLLEHVFPKS